MPVRDETVQAGGGRHKHPTGLTLGLPRGLQPRCPALFSARCVLASCQGWYPLSGPGLSPCGCPSPCPTPRWPATIPCPCWVWCPALGLDELPRTDVAWPSAPGGSSGSPGPRSGVGGSRGVHPLVGPSRLGRWCRSGHHTPWRSPHGRCPVWPQIRPRAQRCHRSRWPGKDASLQAGPRGSCPPASAVMWPFQGLAASYRVSGTLRGPQGAPGPREVRAGRAACISPRGLSPGGPLLGRGVAECVGKHAPSVSTQVLGPVLGPSPRGGCPLILRQPGM